MKDSGFNFKKDTIYLCGHSLGPQSKLAVESVQKCLNVWEEECVLAWNKSNWIYLPYKLGQMLAPLLGAHENEVIVTDSTSVNLFKVLSNAINLNPKRHVILTTENNFPADLYIAQGIEHFNNNYKLRSVGDDKILENLNDEVGVLTLSHVDYRTGSVYDIKEISKKARELGIIVIWDLSHSVGIVPLNLSNDEVDFAIGSTYKYLNGGPGAPSFIYANKKYNQKISSPIYGWMGHKTPFAFSETYEGVPGVGAYLGGTPYILSMKALEGALGLFANISMEGLYKTTLENGNYLIESLEQKVPELICVSNKEYGKRGGHIGFTHDEAYSISRALIAEGLICDYREPNLLRLSVPSLYIDLKDINKACLIIERVINNKIYQKAEF